MIAVWIMAGSLFLLAVCACVYVGLRVSDEMRFRHALDDMETTPTGQIIIPKRQRRITDSRRGDYKRRKAQEWIDMKSGRKGGMK